MALKLTKANFGGYWKNEFTPELAITSKADTFVILLFLLSFAASLVALVAVTAITGNMFYDYAALLAVPFFIIGILWYYRTRKWHQLVIIIIITALAIYFLHLSYAMYYIDFILVGSIGVASLVASLQRFLFYRIMLIVENMNRKAKMNFWDTVVAFFFNIPGDLDTSRLTMNYNMKRVGIPWGDIKEMIVLGLMVSLFLWIYLSMNPVFMSIQLSADVPLYLFTIILYIPVIVMPWSIFRSLDVRIETRYRAFSLYSGIKETLKRMVLPMFAALIYVLIAVNKNNFLSVLGFIALSVGMIILIIVFTAVVYFSYFNNKLVDDIVSKWRVFRPVPILLSVSEDVKKKTYPETPIRDMSDTGELVFKD